MAVDESVVAFWNWTRISLALEEEDDQEPLQVNSEGLLGFCHSVFVQRSFRHKCTVLAT
jgi:hypothetical protein